MGALLPDAGLTGTPQSEIITNPGINKFVKLLYRMAQLKTDQSYTITLGFAKDGKPFWSIQPLGKIENI